MRNLSAAINLVEPFVSVDPSRLNMVKPARHAWHVVATDGHTLAVARYDGEGTAPSRTLDTSHGPPPPWEQIIPAASKEIGELNRIDVAAFAHYPLKWCVCAAIGVDGTITVEANIPARVHKKTKKIISDSICMIPRTVIARTGLRPNAPISLDGHYIARCVEAATMGVQPSCYIMAAGPLDPVVFAPDTGDSRGGVLSRKGLIGLDRFAIMMPMRM